MIKKICLPADLSAEAVAKEKVPLWGTKVGIIGLVLILIVSFCLGAKSCTGRNNTKPKTGSSNIPTFMLNAPSNLTATVSSPSQINLSWIDNALNNDGYAIERKTGTGGTWSEIVRISDVTFYSDTVPAVLSTYYYRVRAFNTIGDYSAYSNIVSVFTFDYVWVPISWTAIATGESHSLALTSNGDLWSWGYNEVGQLGVSDYDNRIFPTLIASDWNYVMFNNISNVVANPSPYGGYTIIRKTDGTLWGCGTNGAGQLGIGDTSGGTYEAPYPVTTTVIGGTTPDSDWSLILAGGFHTLAIKSNGTLWVWGANNSGQLGLGDYTDRYTPSVVGTETDWLTVAGTYHTLAIKTGGTLWAWGLNYNGQLGLGDSGYGTNRNTPTQVGTDFDWFAIAAGESHTLAIKNNNPPDGEAGTLWSWGRNNYGQLGDGTQTSRITPRQIGISSDWVQVSAGVGHTIGLKTNNTIWAWGYNNRSQLGLADTINRNVPTLVNTETDWSVTAGGGFHTLALKTNGTLWVWGNNYFGQLGQGDADKISRNIPSQLGSPRPPSNLNVAFFSSSRIELLWIDRSFNESGFKIERSVATNTNYSLLATVGSNVTSYSDSTISPEFTYYYRIRAYNDFGESPYANQVSIEDALIAPSSLTLRIISSSQVNLYWQDNSSNELGFRIVRSVNGGNYIEIGTAGMNTTIYSDTTVTPNNTYSYAVRAYNILGNSSYSNLASTILTPPSPLSIEIIGTLINLSWFDNSDAEDGFEIERSTDGGNYTLLSTLNADTISYFDTTVTPNNDYFYRVRCYNVLVYSDYTNVVATVLPAPWNLSPQDMNTYIRLSWGDTSSFELGFKIMRRTGDTLYSLLAIVGPNVTSYSDADIAPGTRYYYSVNAYSVFGDGMYSNEVSIITSGTPSFLTAVYSSSSQINLSWNDTADNETGFKIERKFGTDGTYEQIATIGANIESYPDIGSFSTGAYYYRVRAYNDFGNSTYSNEAMSNFAFSGSWSIITTGDAHTVSIKTAGTLWVWGNGYCLPTQLGTASDWANVTAGVRHTLALKTNGTLWSWGANNFGQLGLSDLIVRDTPTQMGTQSDWSTITANYHTLGLKTTGTLWVWGYNLYGQLGLGDNVSRNTPTQLGTVSDWANVTAGGDNVSSSFEGYHTLALKTNGTLWSWGANGSGQLGLSDLIGRYTPSSVGTQSDWVLNIAGGFHTLGLKTGGTLWSWGKNNFGQLGLGDSGSSTKRKTPTQIGTASDWANVTAGINHTLALKTNGTLWSWGVGGSGQLGFEWVENKNTPSAVGSETDWSFTAAGPYHSFGIRTSGILFSWGNNVYGQLGLGNSGSGTQRNVPTLVGE